MRIGDCSSRQGTHIKLWVSSVCIFLGVVIFSTAVSHRFSVRASHQAQAAAQRRQNPSAPALENGQRTPVLVELFTSEGCSSCPPADALIARFVKSQPISGAEIIALKEHVDYWNHLGWKDPYSSAEFSARQNEYARAFASNTVYTPQMIVDGRTEFVGSAEGKARQAIAQAARSPKVAMHLGRARKPPAGNEVSLEVRVEQLRQVAPGDTPELYLAITENNLHSDVLRGENAGSKFDHFAVVRELKQIGTANVQAANSFTAQPVVKIAGGWKWENLRVVIFVQEKQSRRVLAAATIPLAAE